LSLRDELLELAQPDCLAGDLGEEPGLGSEPLFDVDTCRECGCSDDDACEGGCFWVEADLCSRCAFPEAKR